MKIFWSCFAIDCLVFLGAFWFFMIGLGDGTVSAFNIAIWLPLVGVPAAVVMGGLLLKANGRPGLGKALLAALAVPSVLVGGFGLAILAAFVISPGGHH